MIIYDITNLLIAQLFPQLIYYPDQGVTVYGKIITGSNVHLYLHSINQAITCFDMDFARQGKGRMVITTVVT